MMNLDSAIFIGFLVTNVIFGLYSSRGIKNIKEYAVGNRDFSTMTIASTLIATWISGSMFFVYLSETYTNGLYFIWASVGDVFCLLVVGFFFAPRMGEFLGRLSIAEAMGCIYGERVRVVTAIAGFIGAAGMIACQLKVAGILFELCFNIPEIYGSIVGSLIVTLYASLGGIRSVTFTDVIQLITFGTIIPTLAIFIAGSLDTSALFSIGFSDNEAFNYKEVFDFSKPKSLYYMFLFFFMAIPGFNPAIFQRIAMAKNTMQVRNSFVIAGFTCLFITLTMSGISLLILSNNPNLSSNDIVKHIIFEYSYTGLKGLTLAGIMAMVMSTADSYINSTSILFIHDFCRPLKINLAKNELNSTRIAAFAVGSLALFLALSSKSLLKLGILVGTIYMPVVTLPFILSILGFRSSSKSILIGMAAGFFTVTIWEILPYNKPIDSVIPGMMANLLFLLGSHYLLKQPGGWVGIKDYNSLKAIQQERRFKRQKLINTMINFNPLISLKNNTPTSEAMYAYFGLFSIILIYATMYTIPKEIQQQYFNLINVIAPIALFLATATISYPLWPASWKTRNTISIIWNITVFYILAFMGLLFVIISNFAPLHLIILMANMIVLAVLVRWQWALVMMTLGVFITIQVVKSYLGSDIFLEKAALLHYKVAYLLILLGSVLIVFLKPKQEQQELSEEKAEHLSEQINYQQHELEKALTLKNEFLRNVSHEYHSPMTGVISTAEALLAGYDKFNEDLRKSAIKTIYNSAIRLESYDANIRDLSRLSNAEADLNITRVNLSELTNQRLEVCRKLYIEEQNKENCQFIINIEDNLIVDCDEYYLKQTLDNLMINAITYCRQGKIIVDLRKKDELVKFSIRDEGIGIPNEELYDIFGAFTVSSKTRTPAGGRGVGLALCKKVIEMHNGRIWAESKEGETTFFFEIPISFQEEAEPLSSDAIKIAKSLLENGVDIKLISEATGLKRKQIEILKRKK